MLFACNVVVVYIMVWFPCVCLFILWLDLAFVVFFVSFLLCIVVCDDVVCVFCLCVFVGGVVRVFV